MSEVREILKEHGDSIDHISIIKKAIKNRIFPQFYHNLILFNEKDFLSLPSKIKRKLRSMHYGLIARSMVILDELKSILKRLEVEGIKVFPIKGILFALTIYPDPHMRMMRDIDLWVPAAEGFKKVDTLLLELGFRWEGERCKSTMRNPVPVDVLYEIDWLPIEKEKMLKRAVEVEVAGIRIYLLSPEDSFLMLCAHSFFHCRVGLIDLSDAFYILKIYGREFDWTYIFITAINNGLVVPLYCYLNLLSRLYSIKDAPERLLISLEKLKIIRLFKSILNHTWSVEGEKFGFILRLYKEFFIKRENIGFLGVAKDYFTILHEVVRDYVRRGEIIQLLKSYFPSKLVAAFKLLICLTFSVFR